MPSPIGHALAGLTVGWLSQPVAQRPAASRAVDSLASFSVWCACVAAIPDADLLAPHFHRTATHSLTATALVFIMAVAVTGKVTRQPAWMFVLALSASHASHLLLDWLGTDRFPPPGLQMLWPFSDHFFYSGLDLFPPVERRLLRPEALRVNAIAALWELLIMGPIAAAAWAIRARRHRTSRPPTSEREASRR
ncbi:MAG TPA: metal-dependent hydrolase [Vicinamibacterales bacterium]|nr:metal-dependent hydrolase [Vicinamibacterales bacterium]